MPTHLHTVGLVARSMPATLAFYRTLGLEIPAGGDDEPHVEFAGPDGLTIGFVSEEMVRRTDPGWRGGEGAQRLNLQFRCADPAAVDDAFARIVGAGHEGYKAPWDAFWGQRFARVVDPDGNVVNLFAPLGESGGA